MNTQVRHFNAATRLAIEGGHPIRQVPISPSIEIGAECKARIMDLLNSGALSTWYGGPASREFERAFAGAFGMEHGLAVNSGTSALHAAYVALGIGPGDEVIMPAVAYVSAASAAIQEGALPVICDVEPWMLTMCPEDMERRITPRTRLIVPVHMWGIPGDMDRIMAVARKHGIPVLEDCGQAHGARFRDRLVGSFGDASAFSFAPRKHICTGQGGMALCRKEEHAAKARSAANKGKGHGWHDYNRLGYSYVMTDMEALVGLDGLAKLEQEVAKRCRAAEIYASHLAGTGLVLPTVAPDRLACWFKYPFRLPETLMPYKEFMILALAAENISTRASHPPMHSISWLADHLRRHASDNPAAMAPRPVAEREAPHIIEVETGPAMTEEDVHVSARGVLKVLRRILEMQALGIVPETSGEAPVT